MKQPRLRHLIAASTLLLVNTTLAQDPITDALRMTYTDVAEVKRKAEAGDAGAQFTLAETLGARNRPAEALTWYRKAAQAGNIVAVYRIGTTLMYGAPGSPVEQSVKPEPATGIQFVFCAATNRYHRAFHDMYRAYKEGIGVGKDMAQAYAWLQLEVDTSSRLLIAPPQQAELNSLALAVDVQTSQAGKRLAARYNAGQWPTLTVVQPPPPKPTAVPAPAPPKPAPKPDPGLKLNGIALGKTPLAIINGKGVAEGESVTVLLKPNPVTLKCVKIEKDFVLVTLEGEDAPRRLNRN